MLIASEPNPLLLTTLAINHAVSGLDPWSHHLVNIALHWLVVALIFHVVRVSAGREQGLRKAPQMTEGLVEVHCLLRIEPQLG